MLAAERYRKISPDRPANERMEDILTSHVFSLFRYFSNHQMGVDFLNSGKNLAEGLIKLGSLQAARVVFWPKFTLKGGNRREADALLLLEENSGGKMAILVEAKYEAGLHNLERDEDEGPQEQNSPMGHQLADELSALMLLC